MPNPTSRLLVVCLSALLAIACHKVTDSLDSNGSSNHKPTPTFSFTPTPTPTIQSCEYNQFATSMLNRVESGLNLLQLSEEVARGKSLLETIRQNPECLQAKEILKRGLWKAESQIAHIEVKRDAAMCGASSDFYGCEKQVRADYAEKLGMINEYYRKK